MRKILLLLPLVAALAVGQSSFAATNVTISKTGFHPTALTIPAGDTVTWMNTDTVRHQVVADNGSFSSPVLAAGQSYSHAFTAGGTFAYHDGVHPAFKATLAVVPPRTVWFTHAGLVPSTITIKAGQSVRWVNKTTANQQVVADDSAFSSPVLSPGQAYSHTFTGATTYRYHDGLQPSITGTVIVTPVAAESITLASNTHVVTYGGGAVLTGKLANGTVGEKVTLAANPQAGETAKSVETVSLGTDGTFRVDVQPLVQTAYIVSAASSTSSPVVINVRPRLRLGRISHHRAVVRASAANGFLHRYAFVQRWNARRQLWVSVRRVRFTSTTSVGSQTVVSSGSFSLRFRHGTRVRVFMPRGQAAPGYTSTVSNAIRA